MSLPNAITREDFYLNKIANPSDDHELPDAITRTQKYLKAIAENAGGGGSDAMMVIITESEGTYTADHTYEEIRSAVESGVNVFVKKSNANGIYHLYNVASTSIQFIRYMHNYRHTYDEGNGTYLADLSNINELMFKFNASGISLTAVYYQTNPSFNLSDASGTLTDEQMWTAENASYGMTIWYLNYKLQLYFFDTTTIKLRDAGNIYECVINRADKSYVITAL